MTQIIMLPTDKEPITGDLLLRHLWKNNPNLECKSLWQYKETVVIGDVKQYTTLNGSFRDDYKNFEVHHLYEVSEEEIKEGDWYFDGTDFIHQKSKHNNTLVDGNKQAKKVIKTTDKDLQLPTFSEDFLVQYIENFTKENPKTFKITKNSWNRDELEAVVLNSIIEFQNSGDPNKWMKENI